MSPLRYSVLVSPLPTEDGGGFLATVPDLPGCVSDGETPQEAISNVEDAIASWIEAAHDMGRDIPQPSRWTAAG
ncbi:type II toxin-antitoxin system HicB family antitoxin [Neorhizobium sp. CSC1952]|uniref:type II toxin-antitoxin system HicB family antitoxin n=1 Tax=Neorhizobium TaxID=1525371 RepID=UPI0025A505AD|nr:type II toxin-antitoxin system HicB family antitoxin [Rhizobium sp. CSC1952]WJR67705.1 type II toxin-antitoxin system HicB family antitoxin [Rhizobium sp. CSC1952]